MSACRFERALPGSTEALARAKRETVARGGTFEGGPEQGHYRMRTPLGWIEGTYTVAGATLSFVVDRKPALVPCAAIARVLDQFLAGGTPARASPPGGE